MTPIRDAVLLSTSDRGVSLDCGGGITCGITVLGQDLVRVAFLRDETALEPRSWMVIEPGTADVPWEGRDRRDMSAWPTVPVAITADPARIVLATAALRLEVNLAPLGLRWSLPDGTVFAQDRPAQPYLFGRRRHDIRHSMGRDPADRYYGLGDKTGALDLRGRRLRTTMVDSLGYDPERGDPLYKHWPFVITQVGATGTAWGVFYDSMAEAVFDLGCEHDNYHGLYRSYETTDGDLDYYMFIGPQIVDVTRKFLDLTGRPPVPPRWTLGFAQTAMAIADVPDAQAEMEKFIALCAAEQVPVSAFHFGSGYTSIGPRRYVFHWNRTKFPDPDGLMQRFHAAGIHVVANLKPCLLDDHPRYAELLASGGFVSHADGSPALSQFWDGEGAHLDFTNPVAIAWWQDGLRGQVLTTGMDVAWNDNNEYGFRDEAAMCHGFGTTLKLDRGRALQSLLMTRASREAQQQRRPRERAFSVTRAGCPGIQRHAQTWSGDNSTSWRSLKWNLRTGLQMGLSGMGNIGHDVGGFSGPIPEPELLIRWTQAGSLHPRFIMNSWKPDGVYTSPWLHAEATPAIRAAIRLRYRLIPYLYSLMHDTGRPPLLPCFVSFPDDPACWEDRDELLLGPFLMAAPVVEAGARSRSCHLPAGPECWFDFWTEERLAAGSETILAAPIDRLPLVVPAGAILPLTGVPADESARHDETSRCLRLFPGPGQGTSRFVLHEDDGLTVDGPSLELAITLGWTPESVCLHVEATGSYVMPARHIDVCLPSSDKRPLTLSKTDLVPDLCVVPFRLAEG